MANDYRQQASQIQSELVCALTSLHAGSLYVRYLKLAIQKRLGLREAPACRSNLTGI